MTTPEYLEQVVISNRARGRMGIAGRGRRRPSAASVVWAALDVASALLAGLLAFDIRLHGSANGPTTLFGQLTHAAPLNSFVMLLLFGVYLVLISRLFGLYRSSDSFSGLHEQRMTMQTTLTCCCAARCF